MVGKNRVYTLFHISKWITLYDMPNGTRGSLASDSLLDAGSAHLQIANKIKGETNDDE